MDKDIRLHPLYDHIEYKLSTLEEDNNPIIAKENNTVFDWSALAAAIAELAASAPDNIQILLWQLRAEIHLNGFGAFCSGLARIQELLLRLKAENNQAAAGLEDRDSFAAALSWLATPLCITELKHSVLYVQGKIKVKELYDFDHKNNDNGLALNELLAELSGAGQYYAAHNLLNLTEQLSTARTYLTAVVTEVNEYSSGYILDCRHLNALLAALEVKIKAVTPPVPAGPAPEVAGKESPALYNVNLAGGTGAVNSREQVFTALDALLNYFRVYEPSHPAPILLQRARQLIGMDFTAIIKDLLPDAAPALQLYTGTGSGDAGNNDSNNNLN